jgi:hypothetical protein
MNSQSNCRRSVSGAAAAPAPVSQAEATAGQVTQAGKTLDIHVHLFGAGDAGSGCRLSKASAGGLPFKYLALKGTHVDGPGTCQNDQRRSAPQSLAAGWVAGEPVAVFCTVPPSAE